MKYCSLILLLALAVNGCSRQKITDSSKIKPGGVLIFQSGFEPDSKVIAFGNEADITGSDRSFTEKNNWVTDLDESPEIGNLSLQYQGGDLSMRKAEIVADPVNVQNHALHFWLDKPNVNGEKGRIQANLYGNKGMKEFYQSVKMFLPDDFLTVRSYPNAIHWLTIAEFWNNITWSQTTPFGFRITLGIGKEVKTEGDLYFILDAQDCELFPDNSQKYTTIWSDINTNVKVPIGKWFTMDYYYKEGNSETGRFYMAIVADGVKQVVFDHKGFTHNTKDPAPDGVSDFNPLKLYTSKSLIDYMSANNKTLQIYWDDFHLWKDKRP